MCGRFTLFHPESVIEERFEVEEVIGHPEPRYNIAPTQEIAVVTQNGVRKLEAYRWGLVPSWAKDIGIGSKMLNARAETLSEKPSFRTALQRRRCLIPADGFYEWQALSDGSKKPKKQPMYIRRADSELFAFAGLWDEWQSPNGSPLRSCTIITVAANDLMAPIHDRMPAILTRDEESLWLDPSIRDTAALRRVLAPSQADLHAYPVSTQVNIPGNDSCDCIEAFTDPA